MLPEPLGGAHRDPAAMTQVLRDALLRYLNQLESLPMEALQQQRAARIAAFGVYAESDA
jgi:acetyl-CoA carboxylase carboxyl transferase subunit alpha